jgi:hypothetical protein
VVREPRYDWENKVQFYLSALELAELITAPQEEHSFTHDPSEQGLLGRETVSQQVDNTT